ncbi:MAG: carboxy terminal-processing peptidase, partial [Planctomycetia bacterium]
EELKERWRRRVKFDLLNLVVDGEKEPEARDRLARRYRNVAKRWHQMNTDELLELFFNSVTTSFDPHSSYMSPDTLNDFNIGIQLSLEGIGALLQSEDGLTIIKEVVPGGAAAKDGRLQPGDKIMAVGQGEGGAMVDLLDMKLRDVVKKIRGTAGSTVRLEVVHGASQKRETFNLVRQKIELEDRAAKGEVITRPAADGQGETRLGVITLPSFYADNAALQDGDADAPSATNDVRRILEDFKKQKVDGVVMDLRVNGGGLLSEAISLTGLFIDIGPVVQVRDFNGNITPYLDEEQGVVYSGPLVVVVSRFSASASEIFAGAVQDYKRGVIVGDSSSHGKGSVQKIIDLSRQFRDLPNDEKVGAVKLTMQKFYRVNGQSTQNRGVVSDVVLPSATDHDDFGEAKLDYALSFDAIPPADYNPLAMVDAMLTARLAELSKERQANDPELQKLAARKKLSHDRRARKKLTFNEESLRAELAELSDEERDALKDDDVKKKDKKFGEDPYTKEVLKVTADLVRLKDAVHTKN